jgi:DNA-binding CsgD family transcriptional regulator
MIEQLAPLEMDYLRVAAYANKEIARMFGVSEGTVKNRWSAIASKLGIWGDTGPKRLLIVVKALKCGLIDIEELEVPPRRCRI